LIVWPEPQPFGPRSDSSIVPAAIFAPVTAELASLPVVIPRSATLNDVPLSVSPPLAAAP